MDSLADQDFDCSHDAWECTVNGVDAWHKCANGCGFTWHAGSYVEDLDCVSCAKQQRRKFVTRDSGQREEYDSGMVRDTQEGKARFDLLLPVGIPYRDQFWTRVADLLGRGAAKYNDRNWERAAGSDELDRFKSSAQRHLMQWLTDETDEDHAAAVVFNLLAYETIKWKLDHGS